MRGLRRRVRDQISLLGIALALSSCGGGGTSSGGSAGPIVSPTPTPTPRGASCTLRARQDWALAQFNEWYLFPETMSYVNPDAFSNLSDYVDALAAGARAQGKDRFYSYVTSIAGETDYYQNGTTAGFGIRLHIDDNARRVWVSEAFEATPALAAGLDRGSEIIAIGTTSSNLRTVQDIIAREGEDGVYDALGPTTTGTTRWFEIEDATAGRHIVSVSKADYNIQPVSSRYGVRIIDDNGRKVGYINLRTFIYSAENQLRTAFGQLKAQGVQDVIVDLRYNGGGLVSVAQTLGSLLGGARFSSDVFAQLRYRPEKSAENEYFYFKSEPSSIAPRRMAFIATEATASASEMVINAFRPYLGSDIALIGTNTHGKPVGQIALDKSECDDRLRLIAFAGVNSAGQGGYYQGLASFMQSTCRAEDDVTLPLGDARENSVARALDFIAGRPCTSMTVIQSSLARSASASTTPVAALPDLHPLTPQTPNLPQREMPGLF